MSWPSDGLPRFIVVETVGYLNTNNSDRASLMPNRIVAVLDRACCHREVALFRSEDYSTGHRRRVEMVATAQAAARSRARELNAEALAA